MVDTRHGCFLGSCEKVIRKTGLSMVASVVYVDLFFKRVVCKRCAEALGRDS